MRNHFDVYWLTAQNVVFWALMTLTRNETVGVRPKTLIASLQYLNGSKSQHNSDQWAPSLAASSPKA